MAGPRAAAVDVTPRLRGDDPRVAYYKLYRNPDPSYSAILYTGPVHYQAAPGGPWLDKVLRFVAGGTRTGEQRSIQSDVSMATWQEGSGANRRWFVEFKETLSGRGIQFQLAFQPTPVAGTNELRFTDSQARTWSYFHTRVGGKMLGPAIAVAEGPKPFSFPYVLIGGAPPLEKMADGSVRSADAGGTVFAMAPPHFNGADGRQHRQTEWTLVPGPDPAAGGTLSFTIDDTGLPASAFPYRLDPSTSFSIASGVGTDDQYVERSGAAYPPAGALQRNTTADRVWTDRDFASPNYFVDNALLRWPTSALPDAAPLQAAFVRGYVLDRASADALSLVMEYYGWDGSSASDHSATPVATAHAGTQLANIVLNADNDFALQNLTSISLTGTTSVRLHVTQRLGDVAPTSNNYVTFASLEHATLEPPRLYVDYAPAPSDRVSPDALLSASGFSGALSDALADDASWLTGT